MAREGELKLTLFRYIETPHSPVVRRTTLLRCCGGRVSRAIGVAHYKSRMAGMSHNSEGPQVETLGANADLRRTISVLVHIGETTS